MMRQDRWKHLLWFWLLKSVHPCLAGRRSFWDAGAASSSTTTTTTTKNSNSNNNPYFARLGRLPLSRGEGEGWNSKQQQKRERSRSVYYPDTYHGLSVDPSSLLAVSEQLLESVTAVRPVSLLRRRQIRRKETKLSSSSTSEDEDQGDGTLTTVTTTNGKEHVLSLTRPLIATDAWEAMTGAEFDDEDAVHALSRSGLELCTPNENPHIEWKAHKDTVKILKEQDRMEALEEGKVLVYVGKVKQPEEEEMYFGSHLPLIQTQSILPFSANDMANLLMDSERVKIYNKMSLGRKDVRIYENEKTKIVCNLTQPPVAKSKMVSVTLMHSRSLQEDDHDLLHSTAHNHLKEGYLVVSRAVPGLMADDLADLPRNDILLGVNLLQELGPDRCLMTAVTHIHSPALPTILARSIGVSSAVNFVRDIRNACAPEVEVAAN